MLVARMECQNRPLEKSNKYEELECPNSSLLERCTGILTRYLIHCKPAARQKVFIKFDEFKNGNYQRLATRHFKPATGQNLFIKLDELKDGNCQRLATHHLKRAGKELKSLEDPELINLTPVDFGAKDELIEDVSIPLKKKEALSSKPKKEDSVQKVLSQVNKKEISALNKSAINASLPIGKYRRLQKNEGFDLFESIVVRES